MADESGVDLVELNELESDPDTSLAPSDVSSYKTYIVAIQYMRDPCMATVRGLYR